MKQKSGPVKQPAEEVVRDLRRATRRQFSAEEKIRIVLEGLRGEESIAELCRREGIASSMYYGWSKDFLEAGKKRLAGDTARAATPDEGGDTVRPGYARCPGRRAIRRDRRRCTRGLLKNRLSNASTGRSRDQRHDRSSRRGQAAFASWMFGRRSGSAAKVRMSARRAAASRFRLIAAAVR